MAPSGSLGRGVCVPRPEKPSNVFQASQCSMDRSARSNLEPLYSSTLVGRPDFASRKHPCQWIVMRGTTFSACRIRVGAIESS